MDVSSVVIIILNPLVEAINKLEATREVEVRSFEELGLESF
jgi:hypothetical protein